MGNLGKMRFLLFLPLVAYVQAFVIPQGTFNDTDIVKGLPGGVNCKTDTDCPCSYCKNDKTKTPPFLCQTPKPGICCKDDADCKANGSGSYCQTYKPKSGTASMPWHCHLASTEIVTGLPGGVNC